jgi:hypothetical protein
MTRYYLEITVQATGLSRDDHEAIFEPLADAVYDLGDVIDAELGADLTEDLYEFTMAVDATDEVEALRAGLAAVRCAIHTVGAAPAGWDNRFKTVQQVVRDEAALT